MAEEPLRYVVLRHEGVPEPHFDVMCEAVHGSPLVTIRTQEWPMREETPFQRLPDHRRLYLDYEGPVSNDRGHVRRVATGTCRCEAGSDDSLIVRFDTGLKLRVPRTRMD